MQDTWSLVGKLLQRSVQVNRGRKLWLHWGVFGRVLGLDDQTSSEKTRKVEDEEGAGLPSQL